MPYFKTALAVPCQNAFSGISGVKTLSKPPCRGVFEASEPKRKFMTDSRFLSVLGSGEIFFRCERIPNTAALPQLPS
jgi:hypothetical protein